MGYSSTLICLASLALLAEARVITVYDGQFQGDWQYKSMSWNLSPSGDPTVGYTGDPVAPNNVPVISATINQYGAISLYSPTGFAGATTLSFQIATSRSPPNFAVYPHAGTTSSQGAATQLNTQLCGPFATGTYSTCTIDVSKWDPSMNRIDFMNWDAAANTAYLTNIQLTVPDAPTVQWIYHGSIDAAWQNWTWNIDTTQPNDWAYTGAPATSDGSAAIHSSLKQYGAFSFVNPNGFADATVLQLDIASTVSTPNYAVYFQVGTTSTQSSAIQLGSTASGCGAFTVGQYTTCKLDLTTLKDFAATAYTRINIQAWEGTGSAAAQVVNLANIKLIKPAATSTTVTIPTVTVTGVSTTVTPTLKAVAAAAGRYFGTALTKGDLNNKALMAHHQALQRPHARQ